MADAEPAGQPDSASAGMPPWLLKATVLVLSTVAGFLVVWWLLIRLRGLIVVLLISLFLALAIEPAVNWLADRGWRRGLATGLLFLGLLALVGLFATALGSLFVGQVNSLVRGFPDFVDGLIDWINRTFHQDISTNWVQQQLANRAGSLSGYATRLAGNLIGASTTVLTIIFQTFTVLLFTFYLCADGPRFRRGVCSLLPPRRQQEVLRAWEIAVSKTGGYIYSRTIMAVFSGISHYVLFRILGVPYALALAVWVGVVSQFIPTVGTYLAGALPVLVALTKQPIDALWIIGFIVVYQQVENYLLQPRITARTMNMHPAVAFGTVLAGGAIMGPVGALLALPAGASIQAFIGSYLRRYQVEEHPLVAVDESGKPEKPEKANERAGEPKPEPAEKTTTEDVERMETTERTGD
jgi:predicted PurR-regulated permease PerM